MNINNVILVRAMNNLPLNGELVPSCEGQRLVRDKQSDFYYFIRDYVKRDLERRIDRKLLFFEGSSDIELMENEMEDFYILTGGYYTTTLSFSLNGLVPDDINNKFSDMKMAILEPLKNQVNADFVTIETIDVTVKGSMKMSSDAILVVEREFFSRLSLGERENLMSNFRVRLFSGKLKDAVSAILRENNYPVLDLVQNRELYNIVDSPEKESMLEFENQFSTMVGASRLRLQQLTLMYSRGSLNDSLAHDKLSEEFDNTLRIQKYYKDRLYSFILTKAESVGFCLNDEEKYYLFSDYQVGIDVMKKIVDFLIVTYGGLENFKQVIKEYNDYVRNNYLTNRQIILSLDSRQKKN